MMKHRLHLHEIGLRELCIACGMVLMKALQASPVPRLMSLVL